MAEGLPDDLPKIIEAISRVLGEEGKRDLSLVLAEAAMRVRETSYDNWNGGTYGYTLELQVSARRFAALSGNIDDVENDLKTRISRLARLYPNEHVEAVVIAPSFSEGSSSSRVEATTAPSFWKEGRFRLFLSHVSKLKVETVDLAERLSEYGVTGFVAHEDIEPTKEWEEEIRLALTTCDALAALLSDGFRASTWTDQEVGFAIGRGILVVPIRMGLDPYGFMARYQGYQGSGKKSAEVARSLVAILAKHDETRLKMASALVAAFAASESFADAKLRVANLELVQAWSPELLADAKRAVKDNYQINKAFGVPEKLERILVPHSGKP